MKVACLERADQRCREMSKMIWDANQKGRGNIASKTRS